MPKKDPTPADKKQPARKAAAKKPAASKATPRRTASASAASTPKAAKKTLAKNASTGKAPAKKRAVKTRKATPAAERPRIIESPAARPPRWKDFEGRRMLGVVMIVKNEQDNLPELFDGIRNVADEVVVVDTGSTDRTKEVCREWGVRLLETEWKNDFSRARNKGILAARSSYLMWLDGDDRVPVESAEKLIHLRDHEFHAPLKSAYECVIENPASSGSVQTFMQPRIFPNMAGVLFEKPVHEQLLPAIRRKNLRLMKTDIRIVHMGYPDATTIAAKALRNEQILAGALRSRPDDVHLLLHLGQTAGLLGRAAEAEELLTRAIDKGESAAPSFLAEMYAVRAQVRYNSGNALGAKLDLKKSMKLWPEWAVSAVLLAEVLTRQNEWEDAIDALEEARRRKMIVGAIAFPMQRIEASLSLLFARCLVALGQKEESLGYFRTAFEKDPSFASLRNEYGQLLLELEQYGPARDILEPLAADENAAKNLGEMLTMCTAISLARAGTGDMQGAGEILTPVADHCASALADLGNITEIELAEILLRNGLAVASRNLLATARLSAASEAAAARA